MRAFTDTLKKVFDCSTPGREAARQLLALKQGQSRVADHAIRFRTLAADSEWNSSSLCDTFLHSLTDEMKDHLAPLDLPTDFDSLVALAVKVDNRLFERRRKRARSTKHLSDHWGQLTPRVQVFQSQSRLATLCASEHRGAHAGGPHSTNPRRMTASSARGTVHLLRSTGPLPYFLSSKRSGPSVKGGLLVSRAAFSSSRPHSVTNVQVTSSATTLELPAFIDSGADENFMDQRLAHQL